MTPLDKLRELYITEAELAQFLGISVRTLRNWASIRKGPERLSEGRTIKYRLAAVEAWLKKRERAS